VLVIRLARSRYRSTRRYANLNLACSAKLRFEKVRKDLSEWTGEEIGKLAVTSNSSSRVAI
jgi:hypothetical protein